MNLTITYEFSCSFISDLWINQKTKMDMKKKFKVLLNNQAYMARLGIYSYNLTKPTNEEFFKHFMSYYILSSATICCISSYAFIMQNITQVKQSLNAFKIIISALQFGGMFLYVGLNLDKVKALHLKLQDIIDEGNWHFGGHNR